MQTHVTGLPQCVPDPVHHYCTTTPSLVVYTFKHAVPYQNGNTIRQINAHKAHYETPTLEFSDLIFEYCQE